MWSSVKSTPLDKLLKIVGIVCGIALLVLGAMSFVLGFMSLSPSNVIIGFYMMCVLSLSLSLLLLLPSSADRHIALFSSLFLPVSSIGSLMVILAELGFGWYFKYITFQSSRIGRGIFLVL